MIPLGTLPIPTDSMSAFVMPTWPGSRLGIVRKQNGKHVVGFIGLILRFRILRLDIYSFGRHIGSYSPESCMRKGQILLLCHCRYPTSVTFAKIQKDGLNTVLALSQGSAKKKAGQEK